MVLADPEEAAQMKAAFIAEATRETERRRVQKKQAQEGFEQALASQKLKVSEQSPQLRKAAGITPLVVSLAAKGDEEALLFLKEAEERVRGAVSIIRQGGPLFTTRDTSIGVPAIVTDKQSKERFGRGLAFAEGGGAGLKQFNIRFARETSVLESRKGAASGESRKAGLETGDTGFLSPITTGTTFKRTLQDSIGISDSISGTVTTKKGKEIPVGQGRVGASSEVLGALTPKTKQILSGVSPLTLGASGQILELATPDFKKPITKELKGVRQDFPRDLNAPFNIQQFLKEGFFERGVLPFGAFLASTGKTVKDIHGFLDPDNKLGVFFNPQIDDRAASVKSLFKGLGAKETAASSGIAQIIEGSRFIQTSQGPLFIPGSPTFSQFGASSDFGSLGFDIFLGLAPTKKIPFPIKAPALKLVTDSGEVKTIVRELSVGLGPLQKPILTKTQGGFTTGGALKPGVLEKSTLKEITAPGESLEFSSGSKFDTKILTSPQTQDILRAAGKGLPRDKEIVALKTELAGLIEFSAKKVPDKIRIKVDALPETPLSTVAKGAESKALLTEVFPIAPKIKGSFAETIQLESKFLARQSKDPLANLKTLREQTTKDADIDFGDKIFGTFQAKRFQEKGFKALSGASTEKGKFAKVGTNVKLREGETVLNILTKRDARTGGSLSKAEKFPFGIKIERSVRIPVELGSKKTAEFVTIEENALNRLRAGLGLFAPISTKAKQPTEKLRFLKPGLEERIKTPSGFGIGPAEFGLKHDAKLIGQDAPQIADNLVAAGFITEGERVKAIGLRLEDLLSEIDFGVLPVEKAISKSSSSPISKGIEGIIKEGPDIITSQAPSLRFFHGADDPLIGKLDPKFNEKGVFLTQDISTAKRFGGKEITAVGIDPNAKILKIPGEDVDATKVLLTDAQKKGFQAVEKKISILSGGDRGDKELIVLDKSIIQSQKKLGTSQISKSISKPFQTKSISKPLVSKGLGRVVSKGSLGTTSLGKLKGKAAAGGSIASTSFGKITGGSPGKGGAPSEGLTGLPGTSPGSPGTGSPGKLGELVGKPPQGSGGSLGSIGKKGPGILRTTQIHPVVPFVPIGAIVKRSKPEPERKRVDFLGNTLISNILSFRSKKEDIRFGRIGISRIASKELSAEKGKRLIDDEKGTKKITAQPRFSAAKSKTRKISRERSERIAAIARL